MSTDAKNFPLRELYLQAIRLEGDAERESFLNEACENQPQLRSRLEGLLAARQDDRAPVLLEKAAANMEIAKDSLGSDRFLGSGDQSHEETRDLQGRSDRLSTSRSEGRGSSINIADHPMIGHFKLLEEIGHGGMGTVYMAKQTEPVKRQVALKVIKPGMDTREVIARFEAERQALAMMDHPNIAKVFDGGTTDQGRPYFVMELVRGVTITEFCKQKKLPLRDRLELFIDVCKAVQHAHQKGIIHRDLKPSNLLVTMHDHVPVIKVIDFGVAKALNQELTDKTLFTQFSHMLGTPLYMAPEQAQMSGLDIDTRSDIYTLGVILYELLTGTTPFDRDTMSKLGPDGFRKLLHEEEPERPSSRISTLKAQNQTTIEDQRQLDSEDVSKQLNRELDWIVMKALEKDRERRYETANAFAADIQRYLNDEPVEACPPSFGYRSRKYARRNKEVLLVAAIVLSSLMMATGTSAWFAFNAYVARSQAIVERNISQESYAIASDGMDRLLTQFANSRLGRVPELSDIRQQVMEDASAIFSRLIELDPMNPTAYLQRGKAFESLKLNARAISDYEEAVALNPRGGDAHYALAAIYNSCPDVELRDYDRALKHSNRAIEIDPTSVDYRLMRALIVGLRFDYEQSLPLFEEALQIDDSRADIYEARADVHQHNERPRLALRDADHGLSLAQPEGTKTSLGVDYTTTGELYRHRGVALSQIGRYEEALESFKRAIESDPYSLYAYYHRLSVLLKLERYEEAIEDADTALKLQPDFYFIYKRRALANFHLSRYEEALEDLRATISHKSSDVYALTWIPSHLVGACPDQAFRRGVLRLADRAVELNQGSIRSRVVRVSLLLALGQFERARDDLSEIIQPDDAPLSQVHHAALIALKLDNRAEFIELSHRLAFANEDASEPTAKHFAVWTASLTSDAFDDYEQVVELARQSVEQEPSNRQHLTGLGAILMRAGEYEEAKRKLDEAIKSAETDKTSPSYTRYFLAMTEHHLGSGDLANDHLRMANASADEELADSPEWNRKLTLELLRSEAESLINPQSEPSRPDDDDK